MMMRRRFRIRYSIAPLVIACAALAFTTCGSGSDDDPCANDIEFNTEVGALDSSESLPDWAIGEFGYHRIDIYNYRVSSSGETTAVHHGGDVGGCADLVAVNAGDRVVLQYPDGEPRALLVESDGEIYLHRLGGGSDQCEWYRLERSALCGRDVGGCGGFGSSEPCSWDEGGCDELEPQPTMDTASDAE